MPVRVIQLDIPISEAYSLESVGKHGFGKCVYKNFFFFNLVISFPGVYLYCLYFHIFLFSHWSWSSTHRRAQSWYLQRDERSAGSHNRMAAEIQFWLETSSTAERVGSDQLHAPFMGKPGWLILSFANRNYFWWGWGGSVCSRQKYRLSKGPHDWWTHRCHTPTVAGTVQDTSMHYSFSSHFSCTT